MELCFSCFTVKVMVDFHMMTVAREITRLVPLNAMPTGRPTPLANAAMLIPPLITVDVIIIITNLFQADKTAKNFLQK